MMNIRRMAVTLILLILVLSVTATAEAPVMLNCTMEDIVPLLKEWKIPSLTTVNTEEGVVSYAMREGPGRMESYSVRIVEENGAGVKYVELCELFGDVGYLKILLPVFYGESEELISQASLWIDTTMECEEMEEYTVAIGDVVYQMTPAGKGALVTFSAVNRAASDAGTENEIDKRTFDSKPGLDGSNAYDITVSLEGMGFDIGKRQRTATKDGYTWSVSHWTADASYSAIIETNDDYEIYDATFIVTGDATYLPWAATLPHDQSQQESTVAWVKECQRSAQEATITVGDAVWTYKPSNGGGILRVQDVDAAAYADAMLDKLLAE